ncbi:hypothetical protein C8N46_102333 [Kordia periserrulae]|uniref:Uncharacterized protein n=1 Tax=Kordia periserrulae TaxID=701523 RepID=A0A2T6C3P1_9FLAO|nr:hypothetical protein [Kordia periserrulae]PTX62932.1 hypothetical protein C8N46_102333 [Kordia periserrulae]
MKKTYIFIACLLVVVNVYAQTSSKDKLAVEGEVVFVSKLPKPNEIDYPNCNYSAIVKLNSKDENTRVNVIFQGIVNKQKVATANFKIGDKLKLNLLPFNKTKAEVRQTQLVDEVDDFDMKVYYALEAKKIKQFSSKKTTATITTTKEKVAAISTLEKDRKAVRIRKKKIKSEIQRIEKLLQAHGNSWEQWEKDIQDFKAEYAKATEAKASKWIGNSFFSAGNAYAEQNEGNFVEAMTRFNTYLKQYNIDLIVIRIPFKGEVAGDFFSDKLSDGIVNPYAMKVTLDLLKNGIEVHDILPKLIEEREKHPLLFWYNDFEETHPAEATSWIVAKELKEILARYTEYDEVAKITTSLKDTVGVRNGKSYRWPKGNRAFSSSTMIPFKTVLDSTKNVVSIHYDTNTSPFLFIGNSFLAYPSIIRGGSIPHYFIHETGIQPDVYYRSGGVGLGRLIYKKGLSFLENRRAIVYVALPQSFQGTVPVIPLEASISQKRFQEKEIVTLQKDTWDAYVEFPPEVKPGIPFRIQENGYISVVGKNGIKSDGGDMVITIPEIKNMTKDTLLKVKFEFRSVGFGHVVVTYAGEEKRFLRSANVKDGYFETVYFNVKKNIDPQKLIVSFKSIKKKQLIKKINISVLSSK